MAAFIQTMVRLLEAMPAAAPQAGPAAPGGPDRRRAAAEAKPEAAQAASFNLLDLELREQIGPIRIEKGRYFEFIRIDVRHDYYGADYPCPDLRLTPTPQSRERMAMFGIMTRQRPDGIDLLWETVSFAELTKLLDLGHERYRKLGKSDEDFASEIGGLFDPPLLFTVELLNPDFARFTDLPAPADPDQAPAPLSFSTRSVRSLDGDNATLDLSRLRPIERPRRISLAGWMDPSRRRRQVYEDQRRVGARRPDASDGPAQRERGEILERSRDFALLDLHLVADPKKARRGDWDGMPLNLLPAGSKMERNYFHPCTYTLRFPARQTRWRYLVAARQGELDAGSLAIVDQDGSDAGFRLDPEPVKLPHGGEARSLSNDDPVALRARPERRLTLIGRPLGGGTRSRVLRRPLPVASPASLSTGPGGPAAPARAGEPPPPLWSDIYVFL